MSEQQKKTLERIAKAYESVPESQKEGLLRYVEGYADCAATMAQEKKPEKPTEAGE